MSKKKKTYKVSNKPKVAAMNEYIYTDLKKDLAKKYTANRPYKPGKIKKAQRMKGVKVRQATTADKVYDEFQRKGGKRGQFSYIGKNKQLPNVTPKGIDAKAITKANKRAGVGVGNIMNTESVSKAKFGIPKGKNPKIVKGVKKTVGDVVGYNVAKSAESTLPVAKQKVTGIYKGKQQPYKYGTSSPVKLNKKVISGTAKKAVLARGAKIAVKGASRLIPGVGTALLVKDVYDITKWASKQPKVKKASKIYGTQANKIYKYNR